MNHVGGEATVAESASTDTVGSYEQTEIDYTSGWTRNNSEHISVVLLMLPSSSVNKLTLEYQWEDRLPTPELSSVTMSLMNNKLTNMLRRLIHLASTEFTDFNKKQNRQNDVVRNMK